MIELFRLLRDQRSLIARITGGFVFLGLLIALFSPVEYTSEALLMPEMKSSESSAGDLLESYGGMLGLGSMGGMDLSKEGTIAPEVYPKIVKSLGFQHNLLSQDIYFSEHDTTVSGYTYFEEVRTLSLFEFLIEYTIGLPRKFIGPSSPEQLPAWLRKEFDEDAVVELTNDELEVIKEMQERIAIELESETGVLTVEATMPDPLAAAQVNRKMINMLKRFIKSYSTQKAKEDLAFAETQHRQAQERLKEVQDELATFLDQNVNLATAKSRAREQRLQAEFDLAYNMYNSVSQQLMEAKMKVQEQTPVFKPLQSVNIPREKSEPQRILILLLSFFAGLAVSFLYIAGRNIYRNVSHKI
ncbi:Wzz/FepE/Etk N-terminal domain-containing protein [Fodinibius sediminis]|uniref:Chain length determinant protein n=1 Tax=Fodinibius sediminis TaxID=1214077 RepID=A0A521BUU8_9BACT|nr:Wzz/FepE/Etk N-terminal domain-containing protein [Fodinibius sediminis]SMO50943.1 Chain length determinant protein [Fodinibius sediminis]